MLLGQLIVYCLERVVSKEGSLIHSCSFTKSSDLIMESTIRSISYLFNILRGRVVDN